MYKISLFPKGSDPKSTKHVSNLVEVPGLTELSKMICIAPWSPAEFIDHIRNNKNFKATSLLVLDVDDGLSIEDAKIEFAEYQHIIATSRNHRKEKHGVVADRFRVIIPLENPATDLTTYQEHWYAAEDEFPFVDPACKDGARFYFPCVDMFSISLEGKKFANRLPKSTIERKNKTTRQQGNDRKGKLSRATKDFLVDGAPAGQWHACLFKAAMDFKEQGYSHDEAIAQLQKATQNENGVGFLDDHDEQTIRDVFENREPKYGPRDQLFINDWPVTRETKEGQIVPDLAHPDNYRHLIKKLGYRPRVNRLTGNLYNGERIVTDADLVDIFLASKRLSMRCGKEFVIDVFVNMAEENAFDPVKQIIEASPWDGKDYIGELFNTLHLDEAEMDAPEDFYQTLFTKWLVGVVAKLYKPGSQNFVLTFLGAQGIGKSRWLQRLALWEHAFGEGSIDPTSKDHELRHLSNVIWHIPELEYTTGRREAGALKDYLTKSIVSVRPAYARMTKVGNSICSFCASVNNKTFLVDSTGNRRFVVFPIVAIEHMHTVNIQQCFAQAKVLFETGFTYWLDQDTMATVNRLNDNYMNESEMGVLLKDIVPGDFKYTSIQIMDELGLKVRTPGQLSELGRLLCKKGVQVKRLTEGGVKTRYYYVNNLSLLKLPGIGTKVDQ